MITNHTPGPWIAPESTLDYRGVVSKDIVICNEPTGCSYNGRRASKLAWKANSLLISAAPELFQLAQHIIAMKDDAHFTGHPEWNEIVKEAEAITAKATGEKECAI